MLIPSVRKTEVKYISGSDPVTFVPTSLTKEYAHMIYVGRGGLEVFHVAQATRISNPDDFSLDIGGLKHLEGFEEKEYTVILQKKPLRPFASAVFVNPSTGKKNMYVWYKVPINAVAPPYWLKRVIYEVR